MPKLSTKPLNGPALYRVAVRANVSPSTVTRYLDGVSVAENNRRAIVAALRAEGFAHLIPTAPPPPPPAQEPATAA